jgi:hypothetical protein
MVPIEEFIPDVQLKAPSVPDQIAANEIRMAAIELASRVPLLRRQLCQPAQANVSDYFLDAPDGYTIRGIHGVSVYGRPVTVYGGSPLGLSAPRPGAWYDRSEQVVHIRPAPPRDGASCVCVEATVLPGQTTCALPREMYDLHLDTLAAGALARLMLMKDASWANTQAAGIYRGMYVAGIGRASNSVLRGGVTGPLIARPPRFV